MFKSFLRAFIFLISCVMNQFINAYTEYEWPLSGKNAQLQGMSLLTSV